MALFNDEGTPSCPFGCWDLSAMVKATRKRRDVQSMRKNPRLIEVSVYLLIGPIWRRELHSLPQSRHLQLLTLDKTGLRGT